MAKRSMTAHESAITAGKRTEARRQEVGPERWDAAQAWGKAQIEDRAKRLVSFGHEDKTGHGPMAVVSPAQFAELQSTGTIKGGPTHTPPPKWEGR